MDTASGIRNVSNPRDPRRDSAFMRAAIALASRGLGRTAPNPSVAALVVDERADPPRMLGRGFTAPGGRPHAEARALDQAGEAARGATMYVILEPCARRSQTWFGLSCTERILEAGIARVVIGAADPSPFAAGEGAARLRAAGIEVVEGVLAEEAARLNQGHCQRVRLGRPFIQVKLAQTADGFAGTADRKPLAITGEAARAYTHRLRAGADALVTGIGTVLADDPLLDCRLPGMAADSPHRFVLDTAGRFPLESRLAKDAARVPVTIATADPAGLAARIGAISGIEILGIPLAAKSANLAAKRADLAAFFAVLGTRGLTRILVEAGPILADAIAGAGLCDELILLTALENSVPHGLPALGPGLISFQKSAQRTETRMIGPDRLEIFRKAP